MQKGEQLNQICTFCLWTWLKTCPCSRT